jgi:hypothetical protein
MTCTVAAIVSFLGYMPPRGTEIIIPKAQASQYTMAQQWKAKACAAKHGIRWRVAG